MITNAQRAEILVNALPYIKKYYNKIIVVKYGGNAMINEELKNAVMGDLVLLSTVGIKVVLVHGGGPEISGMLNKIGKKSEFVNGLRVTDAETADIVLQILAGKINKTLVNHLQNSGGKAVGLSGMDGHLIEAEIKDPALGFVGEITDMLNEALINAGKVDVTMAEGVGMTDSIADSRNLKNDANFDQSTVAKKGTLQAARLVLRPKVMSSTISEDGKQVVVRTFVMEMADIKTGLIMWKFTKQLGFIKEQSTFGW